MFFLVWFQFINNNLHSYEIGQFPSEVLCEDAKDEASVLITSRTTALYCFEVKPKG